MNNDKLIKLLPDDEEHDIQGLKLAEDISQLAFVDKAVCLPDFHWKATMEAPSSFSVSTIEYIVPHFSSTSMNCGMGLISTGINRSEFTDQFISKFFALFRQTEENKAFYDISHEELFNILREGASAILKKYNLPPEMAKFIESKGDCLQDKSISEKHIAAFLHPDDLEDPDYIGLRGLGLGFGGNHFLEMQYVSEIVDQEKCRELNITPNDMMIMYHTGGGIVPGFIGGYYARRTKGYVHDFRLLYNKLKFHFRTPADLLNAYKKWRYYFSSQKHVAIPANSKEGRTHEVLNQIAMNYGYAYRIATIARSQEALQNTFANPPTPVRLICDNSHNSIQKETIHGNTRWMHRHNACHSIEEKIGILPGMNNTSSFLISGGPKSASTLNTIPHGAGDAVQKHTEKNNPEEGSKQTLKFNNLETEPETIPHINDNGVNSVITHLFQNGLIRPIARLTPVAVLKNFRPKL